ncbi:tyrosine--tRNA ligase, partial [Pseudomonas aeruginosa]
KFNLLMVRELQPAYGQEAPVLLTTPLLDGLGGGKKMSKYLGNYIGSPEAPRLMHSTLLPVPDPLMSRIFNLLCFRSLAEIDR